VGATLGFRAIVTFQEGGETDRQAANFLSDRYHLMITLRAMIEPTRDRGLDDLLILDDTVLVVDPVGNHWVKFVVKQVAPSPERPHGISCALTLHAADSERLVGYDMRTPSAPEAARPGAQARRMIIGTGMA
jgi:hypothetical protein